jgi:hypothetical protein
MANNITRTLLDNAGAAGAAQSWIGGDGVFMVEGTFDGATVALQFKTPNATWVNVSAATALTAAGFAAFKLPTGEIRANVTGGTEPAALFAYAMTTDRQ